MRLSLRYLAIITLTTVFLCTVAAAQQENLKLPPPFVLAFLRLVRDRDQDADVKESLAAGIDALSLKGVSGVGVVVEDLDAEVVKAGLRVEDLQTDVELRLRAAGIRVLSADERIETPGFPWLYVRVNAAPEGRSITYSVELAFRQNVFLERNGLRSSSATTWQNETIGRTDADGVRQVVRNNVDRFANTFLKMNPK